MDRFLDYFEEAADRFSATGKPICLLGNVNINILRAQTCNYAQQFLDCLQSYALLPTIDKPTGVYNNSATLIDNIFRNKFCEYFARGNVVSDITDHFSQFCIFQSSIETNQPAKIAIRDYSKYSEQKFLQDRSQIHWESLLSGSDVDKLFSTFFYKLNKPINKHALRSLGTFRSEDEDDYECEFSVLSMRTSKNVGLKTLCPCSVWKTHALSRPCPPI